ncbi:MAG: hypothetical protein GXO03_02895 [Aquificae bacterium]|nr:hypothetical protein [Aquificota bacterium]
MKPFLKLLSADWEQTVKWSALVLLSLLLSLVPPVGPLFLFVSVNLLNATALALKEKGLLELKTVFGLFKKTAFFSLGELVLVTLLLLPLPVLGPVFKALLLFYLFSKPYLKTALTGGKEDFKLPFKSFTTESLRVTLSPYYAPVGFKFLLKFVLLHALAFVLALTVVGVILSVWCLLWACYALAKAAAETERDVLPFYRRRG